MTAPIRRPLPIEFVVDSSALIAIMLDEPQRAALADRLSQPGRSVISAANVLEATMVASSRFGEAGYDALMGLVAVADMVVMPVDNEQLAGATLAWRRFGRSRHAAQLNFGDCFAYALAAHLEVPLMCVGDDFARTDLALVPL